jgi:type I restriction enzyme S subunit
MKLGDNSSLPENWKWVKAQEVMDVSDGTHDSPSFISEGVPLVTSKNLKAGQIDYSTCSFITEEDHNQISKRSAVDNGDILYAMIGTIGNPVLVNKEREFSIKNVALFKFNKTDINNKYVFHFLKSPLVDFQFAANSRGGTQKFVSLGNIRELQIPLPPLEEQKHIVEILDRAEGLKHKRQQTLKLADEFLRATFLNLFGDPITNPKGWPVKAICEFCKTSSGGTPSRKNPSYYEGDIPWIKSGDLKECLVTEATEFISEEAVAKSSAKVVAEGAILIAMYGATVGRMAVLGIDAATNQAVCSIEVNEKFVSKQYLYYSLRLNLPMFLKNAVGGAQPNINQGMIKNTFIPLPPKPEQDKFEQIVKKVEALKVKMQTSETEIEHLAKSLSQKAFRGELTE